MNKSQSTFSKRTWLVASAILLIVVAFPAYIVYDETLRGEPLCSAAFNQNWPEVSRLIALGANPSDTNDFENYRTALFWAAYYNKADIVRLMIKKGVNVNVIDTHGQTALDYSRYAAITKILQEAGAKHGNQVKIP
jgi:hypothetical protein